MLLHPSVTCGKAANIMAGAGRDNGAFLQAHGIGVTPPALYGAHFPGAQGYLKAVQNPDGRITPKVAAANGLPGGYDQPPADSSGWLIKYQGGQTPAGQETVSGQAGPMAGAPEKAVSVPAVSAAPEQPQGKLPAGGNSALSQLANSQPFRAFVRTATNILPVSPQPPPQSTRQLIKKAVYSC